MGSGCTSIQIVLPLVEGSYCMRSYFPEVTGGDLSSQLWVKQLMVSFRMLYTAGYSLSLFTLVTALIVLLSFR